MSEVTRRELGKIFAATVIPMGSPTWGDKTTHMDVPAENLEERIERLGRMGSMPINSGLSLLCDTVRDLLIYVRDLQDHDFTGPRIKLTIEPDP